VEVRDLLIGSRHVARHIARKKARHYRQLLTQGKVLQGSFPDIPGRKKKP
jgi:hypothetical protein